MGFRGRVIELVVRAEEALDRLKLSYKTRFDRFAPATVVPYRGYGRPDELVVKGRVLEANETGFEPEPGLWTNVRNTIRRLETDEIRGATVRARIGDQTVQVQANDEAFFELRWRLEVPLQPGWHDVEFEIVESMAKEVVGPVAASVIVPPQDADFVVVSDLDDTVVRTGATDRFSLIRTVLLNDARTRLPFEGVVEFYRALALGPSGKGRNPFVYLSRSAWNLYPMLSGFLDHHDFPCGPLLLKEYGLRALLGDHGERFKMEALTELLDFWPECPFVLIGDSGQRDPETYCELVRGHSTRIRTVILRDVTPPERDREVRRIADEIRAMGVPVILAGNSAEAAKKAAEAGLIAPDSVQRVEAERSSEEAAPRGWRRLFD